MPHAAMHPVQERQKMMAMPMSSQWTIFHSQGVTPRRDEDADAVTPEELGRKKDR